MVILYNKSFHINISHYIYLKIEKQLNAEYLKSEIYILKKKNMQIMRKKVKNNFIKIFKMILLNTSISKNNYYT